MRVDSANLDRCGRPVRRSRVLGLSCRLASLPLKIVLARAGDYVSSYHLAMTTVIAEERYAQTLVTRTADGADATSTRTLVSDFVIVTTEGDQPWMAFRDVLEVDGKPVRDRDNRMERLFASGADIDRALAVNRESARYNLGTIVAHHQHANGRARLPASGRATPIQLSSGRQSSERRRRRHVGDHLLRTRPPHDHQDARRPERGGWGSFVIDPLDGRVARTTLNLMGMRATISVDYAIEPHLHVAVPVKMIESYQMPQETLRGGGGLFQLSAVRDCCADRAEVKRTGE